MKITTLLITAFFILSIFVVHSCGSGNDKTIIASDSASIIRGEAAFTQNCSGCHNFIQDGIGPQLAGLTSKVQPQWISNFIQDPKKIIDAGDERAKMLFDKYHTVMPSFASLGNDKLNDIIAYMNTVKVSPGKPDYDSVYLTDPISKKIEMSDLVLNIEEVVQMPFTSDKEPKTRLAKIDVMPGDDHLFILDLRGKLYMLRDGKPALYLNMKDFRKNFIDQPGLATGFGSFAFHPGFQKNGLLYTSHTEPKGSAKADFNYADSIPVELQWVLTEWKTDPAAFPFKGEGRELFRINMVTGIHGMQELTFHQQAKPGDKDYGLLYVGIGDGGCVENNYPFLAHDPLKPWGSIFRIDPKGNNSTNKKYGIPSGNPFVKDSNKLKEIYAYGFRNPHRITWTHDGKILGSHIGQANIESVNLILPGHDYGWPIREGNFLIHPDGNINKPHPLPADDNTFNVTYPVAEYDHDEGKAISGGYEYTGSAVKDLTGKYIFGDINNGRLFYVDVKDLKTGSLATIREVQVALSGRLTSMKQLCGSERVDLRLGKDAKGEIYVFTKPDGKIYRISGVTNNKQKK
ncbi:MAG TPA: PQQ-dependent sugar dehydrogenase [Flavitalea sp.]|nr:PQQ-dependent sugar dehydrogenase [Flavitalea sp.]